MIYLDTHILVALSQGELHKFTAPARRAIEKHEILASAAAVLELGFLHEIGRLKPRAMQVVEALSTDFGLRVCDLPFRKVVEYALQEGWTRDPADRLIVGNAKAAGAQLVTKDARILNHYNLAVW